jgi:hypothetical protein
MTYLYHRNGPNGMMTGMGSTNGMSGAGIGSAVLGGIKAIAAPLAKRALRTATRSVAREGTKMAFGLAGDALLGRNTRQMAKARGLRALKRVGRQTVRQTLMPYAKRAPVPRKKRKKPRNFTRKKVARVAKQYAGMARKLIGYGVGPKESKNFAAYQRAMAIARARRAGRKRRGRQ